MKSEARESFRERSSQPQAIAAKGNHQHKHEEQEQPTATTSIMSPISAYFNSIKCMNAAADHNEEEDDDDDDTPSQQLHNSPDTTRLSTDNTADVDQSPFSSYSLSGTEEPSLTASQFYEYSFSSSPGSLYPFSNEQRHDFGAANFSLAKTVMQIDSPAYLSTSPSPGPMLYGVSPSFYYLTKKEAGYKGIKLDNRIQEEESNVKENGHFAYENESAHNEDEQELNVEFTLSKMSLFEKGASKTYHDDLAPSLAQRELMNSVTEENMHRLIPANLLCALLLCLSQTIPLQHYCLTTDCAEENMSSFAHRDWGSDKEEEEGLGSSKLARHFIRCVKAMLGNKSTSLRHSSEAFFHLFNAVDSHFSQFDDPSEYMGLCECLLETLIDDLSGKAHTHFEGKFLQNKVPEDIKNHISWDSNTSIITNLYTSRLYKKFKCEVCEYSTSFDNILMPLNCIRLPIDPEEKRTIVIAFVPSDVNTTNPPRHISVRVPKSGKGIDLKLAVAERLNRTTSLSQSLTLPSRLVIAEIYAGSVYSIIEDGDSLQKISDNDVYYIYQLPEHDQTISYPNFILKYCFIHHRFKRSSGSLESVGTSLGASLVGRPFVVGQPITAKQLYDMVWRRFNTALGYPNEMSFETYMQQQQEKHAVDHSDTKERRTLRPPHRSRSVPSGSAVPSAFKIIVVDDCVASCRLCDEGFRCDGCPLPNTDDIIELPTNSKLAIHWMVSEEFFDNSLRHSVLLDLTPDPEPEECHVQRPSLYDCFEKLLAPEKMPLRSPWICPGCKTFKQPIQITHIHKLPQLLIIQLSRFEKLRHSQSLRIGHIDFPLHGLDLTRFVANTEDEQESYIYDLHAVLNLSTETRHYSSYIKNRADGRWYNYTISGCFLLPDEEQDAEDLQSILCSGDACTLFYYKREQPLSLKDQCLLLLADPLGRKDNNRLLSVLPRELQEAIIRTRADDYRYFIPSRPRDRRTQDVH